MKSANIFMITDLPNEGENRCTLILGAKDHGIALQLFKEKFPDREAVAIVSKHDLEVTLRNVDQAVKNGKSELFEIVETK